MDDTNLKEQYYQHPNPACEARLSSIQAHLPPVSDSSAAEQNGRFGVELADDGGRDSAVYFIKAIGRNLVKIGYANDWKAVHSRLNTLQTASPYDLEILTIVRGVERDFEQEMHGVFCDSRLRGEWFEYTPEMQEFLRSLDDARCESQGIPKEDIAHFITQEDFDHAAPVL